ncbi:MAG: hypothetical protein ACFFDI_32865 [Promethearchaeota archaeon]
MKWFQRKTKKQAVPVSENQDSGTDESIRLGLFLLLIRPSLSKIFENPPENTPIDGDAIMTSFGTYKAEGINEHSLERIPTLCVTESGHVGYTIPMRLDLQLCLQQLTTNLKCNEYPLGLFTDRDVLVVADGLYKVIQLYHNTGAAMRVIEDATNEFPASKLIWAGTTTEKENMENLRRLEATAKHLLTPEPKTTPKLPTEIADDWLHDFLEPIFQHAKEAQSKSE